VNERYPKFEVIDRRKIKRKKSRKAHAGDHAQIVSRSQRLRHRARRRPERDRAGGERSRQDSRLAAQTQARSEEQELPPRRPPRRARAENGYDASSHGSRPDPGAESRLARSRRGFENLVQQFYVSAMIQMGAGTQEGSVRVDILARAPRSTCWRSGEKTKAT